MTDVKEPGFDPVADQLIDAHRRIAEAMARVSAARDLPELLARLDEFSALLVPHFAAETAAGGFFDVARERASGHFGRLAQLEREHHELVEAVDRVTRHARACLEGPIAAVFKEARALATQFDAHESRENELFLDSMYTDIGDH
jgi:hypothetical protein